ncbi:MAG: 4-alpha-glucanotransferase [Lachnospiraceae bacterium]|nr:4-alpha-glucanotransferase [Lachnospiraceae bacterium]
MKHKRAAGILLPISSLPSRYGIGTMGKEAYAFVDFLKKAGQRYWQILPVGPTSFGDSPYQSFSTFAGNPYFIDPELLIEDGLLSRKDCESAGLEQEGSDKAYDIKKIRSSVETVGEGNNLRAKIPGMYVDYALQYEKRYPLLRKAYANFTKQGRDKTAEYKAFIKKNADWLPEYILFMALKDENGGVPFTEWEKRLRVRKKKAIAEASKRLEKETGFYAFLQYIFFAQWAKLKAYANKNGILIIGDIPIYVAADSADVWGDPELFQLDKEGLPAAVAGCPPDYFAKTGQLWGNPLYNWEYHKKTGYSWWIERMRRCFMLYDVVRIDHFRGFDEYYSIPYGDETAEFGTWVKGPGLKLFDAISASLGDLHVIAEDLGFMTKSVERMVKKSGFPNMKVLLFGFSPEGDSEYLPHNYERNCVVYSGTHDNDTAVGYFERADKDEKAFAKDYLGFKNGAHFADRLTRAALAGIADTVIIPMQDYLGLGNEARLNLPSTLGGINWQWRMLPGQATDELAERIRRMAFVYGRFKEPADEKETAKE